MMLLSPAASDTNLDTALASSLDNDHNDDEQSADEDNATGNETGQDLQDNENSEEAQRSKTCLVCKAVSETYHLNYGASTCFSCRAFFRRALQHSRSPTFICKKSGNCVVTEQNRRSCRKCRYDLCLKAGMRSDSVLDDTQKKVRFRKLIKKIKREGGAERGDDGELEVKLKFGRKKDKLKSSDSASQPSATTTSTSSMKARKPQAKARKEPALKLDSSGRSSQNDSYSDEDCRRRPPARCSQDGFLFGQGGFPNPFRSSFDSFVAGQLTGAGDHSSNAHRLAPFNNRHSLPAPQLNNDPTEIKTEIKVEAPCLTEKERAMNILAPLLKRASETYGVSTLGTESTKSKLEPTAGIMSPPTGSENRGCFININDSEVTVSDSFESNCLPLEDIKDLAEELLNDTTAAVANPEPDPVATAKATHDELLNSLLNEQLPASESDKIIDVVGNQSSSSAVHSYVPPLSAIGSAPRHEILSLHDPTSEQSNTLGQKQAKSFQLQELWDKALTRNQLRPDIVHSLNNFHFTKPSPAAVRASTNPVTMTKQKLKFHLIAISHVFKAFARMNPDFQQLSSEDQELLLHKNTPLFASLILMKYFGSPNGFEQLQWICLGQYFNPGQLHYLSLEYINSALQLFSNDQAMLLYFGKVLSGARFPIKPSWLSILAHNILFHDDPATGQSCVRNVVTVNTIALKASELLEGSGITTYEEVSSLITQLKDMTLIFASNIDWGDVGTPSAVAVAANPSRTISFGFTESEANWITQQSNRLEMIRSGTSLGEDIIEESVKYCFDIPVTHGFMSKIMMTWSQRFRGVMKDHEEFNMLTDAEQAFLWQVSTLPAFGLALVFSENLANVTEQLKFSCGKDDVDLLVNRYQLNSPNTQTKMLSLHEVNKVTKMHDQRLVDDYSMLMRRMRDLLSDRTNFNLLLLYTLFSSASELFSADHPVARVSHRYIYALRRKFAHAGVHRVNRLDSGLHEIKELSNLMKLICTI